jgi:tRNA (guanine-N7-)-methyltransferase
MAPIARKDRPAFEKIPLCYPASVGKRGRSILEIGPGRGDFLFYLADENKDAKIVAVELKSKRYFKLIDRIKKRGLENVQLIQADGRMVIADIFGAESLNEIHINFPDPWPKRGHTKNRLVNESFAKDCERILAKGGVLSIITDAKFYADDILETFKHTRLTSLPREDNDFFPTFFAEKWKREGRPFFWMKWIKEASSPSSIKQI